MANHYDNYAAAIATRGLLGCTLAALDVDAANITDYPLATILMDPHTIGNFGGNVAFQPALIYAPRTEQELLAILARCRGRRIRTVGRLHSWSEAPVADDVMLDLRHFDQVCVEERGGKHWVTVGAGCQIKRLLAELDRQNAGTLPSLGLITEQTIAGAISTGTHGSGRHSMSHYVEEVRVAVYDRETDEPVIHVIDGGPELQAARCSVGALGVIISVSFWSRAQYNVEEHFRLHATLDEALAEENDYPLQQSYLMPWMWQYFVQHRRETSASRRRWAKLYQWYFFLVFDITLHLVILLSVRMLRSSRAVRFFYRHVAPRMVIQNWTVAGKSQAMLVMEHELFRHVEIEMFVRRAYVHQAIDFVIALLKHLDGDGAALDGSKRERLQSLGLLEEIDRLCGSYTHHYPICIRRVLPDDALISMTSGVDEPSYALSFISYAGSHEQHRFLAFAGILSKALAAMFDGRPHWGKLFPLSPNELDSLYPGRAQFRAVCVKLDPNGAFQNQWLKRWLLAGTKPPPEE